MAMARLISQTLTHHPKSSSSIPRILAQRHRSGKPHTSAQITEVDLDSSSASSSSSSPSSSEGDTINGGIGKLEEVIQNIIVRRSAPDWLPFRPGSSYWVPLPNLRNHPYDGVVEVVGRLSPAPSLSQGNSSSSPFEFLSEDETMSFSSSCGWPSSSYFILGSAPTYPEPIEEEEVEVEVKIGGSTNENEEG